MRLEDFENSVKHLTVSVANCYSSYTILNEGLKMGSDAIDGFVFVLDAAIESALECGISNHEVAGVLLGRLHHVWLMDDAADIEGLESLLQYSLDQLKRRPTWDF
jgi:hypothetical protein